jgi:hypothetical protein
MWYCTTCNLPVLANHTSRTAALAGLTLSTCRLLWGPVICPRAVVRRLAVTQLHMAEHAACSHSLSCQHHSVSPAPQIQAVPQIQHAPNNRKRSLRQLLQREGCPVDEEPPGLDQLLPVLKWLAFLALLVPDICSQTLCDRHVHIMSAVLYTSTRTRCASTRQQWCYCVVWFKKEGTYMMRGVPFVCRAAGNQVTRHMRCNLIL